MQRWWWLQHSFIFQWCRATSAETLQFRLRIAGSRATVPTQERSGKLCAYVWPLQMPISRSRVPDIRPVLASKGCCGQHETLTRRILRTFELCLSQAHPQPVTRCRVASCFTGSCVLACTKLCASQSSKTSAFYMHRFIITAGRLCDVTWPAWSIPYTCV